MKCEIIYLNKIFKKLFGLNTKNLFERVTLFLIALLITILFQQSSYGDLIGLSTIPILAILLHIKCKKIKIK